MGLAGLAITPFRRDLILDRTIERLFLELVHCDGIAIKRRGSRRYVSFLTIGTDSHPLFQKSNRESSI